MLKLNKIIDPRIVAVLIASAYASPADDKKKFQKKSCGDCGDDYKPVCGEEDKSIVTFGSECVLSKYNCESGKSK